MPYKNKTKFYRLPSMANGDILTQQQQWIKDSTIDNLLYAATFGCDKCFLEQGKYYLQQHYDDGFLYLIIEPLIQNGFSLMGILNYRMFLSTKRHNVGKLYYNRRYYIYIEFGNAMQINPESFEINYYTQKQEITANNMLLCVVQTFRGDLNIYTDVNKVFAKNILAHTKDNTNPHGESLIQKNLYVMNELKVNSNDVYGAIYDSFITSQNEYIMNIPEGKQIKFVTAYPESLLAGNISWKIQDDKIIFNNSGESGIKINIKLDVR